MTTTKPKNDHPKTKNDHPKNQKWPPRKLKMATQKLKITTQKLKLATQKLKMTTRKHLENRTKTTHFFSKMYFPIFQKNQNAERQRDSPETNTFFFFLFKKREANRSFFETNTFYFFAKTNREKARRSARARALNRTTLLRL